MLRPSWIVVASWLVLGAGTLAAQTDTLPPVESRGPDLLRESVDTLEVPGGVSPLGAFLRAIAVPGWGHAAVGSHGRGGFYLTSQAATGWMLVRTRSRLNDVLELRDAREEIIRSELAAAGVTDEPTIEAALQEDEAWAGADRLATSRQQQFEDWLALGIFTVLLSGADALVSAHLQDFPDVTLTPVGDDGRVELRVELPLGGG